LLDDAAATPDLDWMLLTKRPENIMPMIPERWHSRAPANAWLGVSVESPAYYGRIDALRAVPAVVRFISAEPMLEALPDLPLDDIHWIIFGGESGPGARRCSMDWIPDGVREAERAGVAPFVKQTGSVHYFGRKKGSDIDDLPEDLRVRKFPQTTGGGILDFMGWKGAALNG
jgi:protein gp37